ncbi:MAG: decarboxylating 6-phosphogluconate dehydrogenase [Candidatus Woesearchaeota archaeon]
MKLGFIGLGKMGHSMVKRLSKEHEIVVYNRTSDKTKEIIKENKKKIFPSYSIKELIKKLPKQKIIWLMIPHEAIDDSLKEILPYLSRDDIVIDGGNTNYEDSIKRANELEKKGIYYLDIGTSGGIHGEKNGYCLMVGGNKKAYDIIKPILKTLASKEGFSYIGKSGSGHYIKMIHNGIEYALMQSYAEGFELLKNSQYKFSNKELGNIAKLWNNGSVIRSWLLDLLGESINDTDNIKDYIGGGSTGKWSVIESLKTETPSPMISLALALRYRSRQQESFSGKIVALLRNKFGGHEVKKE